jgi:hypothetical protein
VPLEVATANGANGYAFDVKVQNNQTKAIAISNSGNETVYVYGNGDIHTTGTITSGGGMCSCSDARLKTNVRTIGDALDSVGKLRGVRFDWKKDGQHSIGVIAQEVEKIYPELVTTLPDGMKAVDYGKLAGVLIEAVKTLGQTSTAQAARLDVLATENKTLAEKNATLATRLDRVTSENAALVARLQRLENAVDKLASVSPKRRPQLAAACDLDRRAAR